MPAKHGLERPSTNQSTVKIRALSLSSLFRSERRSLYNNEDVVVRSSKYRSTVSLLEQRRLTHLRRTATAVTAVAAIAAAAAVLVAMHEDVDVVVVGVGIGRTDGRCYTALVL